MKKTIDAIRQDIEDIRWEVVKVKHKIPYDIFSILTLMAESLNDLAHHEHPHTRNSDH